ALNGFGGGASLLVAAASYLEGQQLTEMNGFVPSLDWSIALIFGILTGAVTLTGSFVAVGKLMGKINDAKQIRVYKAIVKLGFAFLLSGSVFVVYNCPINLDVLMLSTIIVCRVLGVCLVMPIASADMPVVVSLLNSYSGLARSAAGFVLGNNGLIITGYLV